MYAENIAQEDGLHLGYWYGGLSFRAVQLFFSIIRVIYLHLQVIMRDLPGTKSLFPFQIIWLPSKVLNDNVTGFRSLYRSEPEPMCRPVQKSSKVNRASGWPACKLFGVSVKKIMPRSPRNMPGFDAIFYLCRNDLQIKRRMRCCMAALSRVSE